MLFKNVIGLDTLKQRLINNVEQKRTGHAQLFLGSDDSGTLAIALAFARYVQCRDRGPQDACGTCSSCVKFDKLAHPDLHFFFPSAPNQLHKDNVSSKLFLNEWREMLKTTPYFSYYQWLNKLGVENKQAIINAEDCNNIIRALGFKAYESKYRVVLIYMVEKLFHSAAPKLLKTLEEPPENTLFLMVSENKDRILNTILSRAQLIHVPMIDEQDVAKGLAEQFNIEPQKARQAAFLSGGSITEALKLCRTDEGQMADFESFREWMRYCYKNDVQKILTWVEHIARAGREKQKSFFQYGLKIFRTCLLHNYNAETLIRLDGEEQLFVKNFAPFVNHTNTLQIVELFNTAIAHLERNANPKILFADLSFSLHRLMHIKAA